MLRGAVEEPEAGSIERGRILLSTEVLDGDFLLLSLTVPLVIPCLWIAVSVKVGALEMGWRYVEVVEEDMGGVLEVVRSTVPFMTQPSPMLRALLEVLGASFRFTG